MNAPATPPADSFLDAMLTPEEAAEWLKIPERKLREMVAVNKIPAVRLSRETLRFHPRTIVAHFQTKSL